MELKRHFIMNYFIWDFRIGFVFISSHFTLSFVTCFIKTDKYQCFKPNQRSNCGPL
jgi:hypothetical protein